MKLAFLGLVACGGGGQSPPPDARPDAAPFQCLDDSPLEPNDTTQTAFVTPVASQATTFAVSASICPDGDVDLFAVDIPQPNQNLFATMAHDPDPQLEIAILDAAGQPTLVGSGGAPAEVLAVPNPPIGRLFVRIRGNDGSARNNYRLSLELRQQ